MATSSFMELQWYSVTERPGIQYMSKNIFNRLTDFLQSDNSG